MPMTPEAKRQLALAIRGMRARLLDELHDATESEYQLSISIRSARLSEHRRIRRARLEKWIDEQSRAGSAAGKPDGEARERARRDVEMRAAYTLLNRLAYLRLLEAAGLQGPAVVTGGWDSKAYKDFCALAPALVRGDEKEGYGLLLELVHEELELDLPGLFGSTSIAKLVPVPKHSLQAVVEALDDPALESCWTDDMTLGWVYQYWNDPEREALDAKLNNGGKIEPHEIASKTQMFTERYMVDWLLQNSLGPMWLAMCRKHGWTAEVEDERNGQSLLARLEERRADWRQKRERGEVELTELMPLHGDTERRWAYYVPQPIPADAIAKAPDSVREIRILDPACGSGHFLVVALDLLAALYREEARHRGEQGEAGWSEQAIVESILENNLYGVDIDIRAVQIAAAALWLAARLICRDTRPAKLGLVASSLKLASMPDDDPGLVELRQAIWEETGIPEELTNRIVHALRGADHLGSLLKVDAAVREAIAAHERAVVRSRMEGSQGDFFTGFRPQQMSFDVEAARQSIEDKLERFLMRHTSGDDLGIRLLGEQLAQGVRFVRMMREGSYDLVVGNPPYQGTGKMRDAQYVQTEYPRGKADLYAAFLERGLELCREGGVSALLTMRSWMFLKQYSELRRWLLKANDLRALGDLDRRAFEDISGEVVAVAISVFHKIPPHTDPSMALQPTPLYDQSRDSERTRQKRASLLCQAGKYMFSTRAVEFVPEGPLVYWWSPELLKLYDGTPLIGEIFPIKQGLITGDNTRFLRRPWEGCNTRWVPYIKGAEGRSWFEPMDYAVNWAWHGIEIRTFERDGKLASRPQNLEWFLKKGIAFASIGTSFSARAHRHASVFDRVGSSVFPTELTEVLCLLNSAQSRMILSSLNPGMHFEIGDVARIPLSSIESADQIYATIDAAFTEHESHREPSIEFRRPGPSPWRYAQDWAQRSVDRPQGAPLPPYEPVYDTEPPTDHLSYALGTALGRFDAAGQGILDPATADLSHALPGGILFLDGSLQDGDDRDSLGHPAARPLHAAWAEYGPAIDSKLGLRAYLRTRFFADVHRPMYENRPIHWPLSSDKKTFIAWVTIHRWTEATLRVLLAEYMYPTLTRLQGELADLTDARFGRDKQTARAAERRFEAVQKAQEELAAFIRAVEGCAEKGPPQSDSKCTARERDARYAPDLDDGVMINSAALWPLLEPQWKDPKKWWKELATPNGRKDYDWAHLAMRYFPERVDAKCQRDPSLAVAHGCFWRYHPARAWAWELRLQDEIGPDFRIDEPGAAEQRAIYLRDHGEEALTAVEKEILRRARKRTGAVDSLALQELWSRMPAEVWQLELALAKKLGRDIHIQAPDEPAARAAFLGAHPARASERAALLDSLQLAMAYGGNDSEEKPGREADGDDDIEEEHGE